MSDNHSKKFQPQMQPNREFSDRATSETAMAKLRIEQLLEETCELSDEQSKSIVRDRQLPSLIICDRNIRFWIKKFSSLFPFSLMKVTRQQVLMDLWQQNNF